ncbi:MAG: TlpA family protein disulfide reductase [Planctomycetota bacterium]|jgi:peroxiredoxin
MKATSHRILLAALLSAAFGNPILAQDPPPAGEPAEEKAEEVQDPEARYAQAKKEYDELIAGFQADVETYIATHQQLMRKGKKQEADEYRRANRPTEKYVDAFLKGAKEYDGSKGAALFLSWFVSSTQSSSLLGKQALEILFEDHVESAEMACVVTPSGVRRMMTSFGREGMRERMGILVERSPYADDIVAPARFILAQSSLQDPKISAEDKAAAIAELKLIAKEQKGRALELQASSEVFQIEKLQVGMEAPEMIGTDLDGRSVRLSDFRGQVVLLEFWADEVTACRSSYTHLKSMHKNFSKTGRYAYFGINCDSNPHLARRAVNDNSLPWRNLWNGEGGLRSGVAQNWNVKILPTNYIIDANGVIRNTTLRGLALERAVEDKLIEIRALPPREKSAQNKK